MNTRARPLSPHLQVYRWQFSNGLSIMHRLSGLALSAGLLALCYWLTSMAGGISTYRGAAVILGSAPGLVIIGAWLLAFYYHLLNGIRHLFWDIGKGFDKPTRRASAWAVLLGSVALTVLTALFASHLLTAAVAP